MTQRMLIFAAVAFAACASSEAGKRPAANPETEPSPITDTQSTEPKTKTTPGPPPATPEVPMPKSEPREPSEPVRPSQPGARNDVTPEDQGNAVSDRSITQKIRQAVVSDNQLSFAAKNVKIITEEGHITLRGEVESDAERARIGMYASQAAGQKRVHNELDVQP